MLIYIIKYSPGRNTSTGSLSSFSFTSSFHKTISCFSSRRPSRICCLRDNSGSRVSYPPRRSRSQNSGRVSLVWKLAEALGSTSSRMYRFVVKWQKDRERVGVWPSGGALGILFEGSRTRRRDCLSNEDMANRAGEMLQMHRIR